MSIMARIKEEPLEIDPVIQVSQIFVNQEEVFDNQSVQNSVFNFLYDYDENSNTIPTSIENSTLAESSRPTGENECNLVEKTIQLAIKQEITEDTQRNGQKVQKKSGFLALFDSDDEDEDNNSTNTNEPENRAQTSNNLAENTQNKPSTSQNMETSEGGELFSNLERHFSNSEPKNQENCLDKQLKVEKFEEKTNPVISFMDLFNDDDDEEALDDKGAQNKNEKIKIEETPVLTWDAVGTLMETTKIEKPKMPFELLKDMVQELKEINSKTSDILAQNADIIISLMKEDAGAEDPEEMVRIAGRNLMNKDQNDAFDFITISALVVELIKKWRTTKDNTGTTNSSPSSAKSSVRGKMMEIPMVIRKYDKAKELRTKNNIERLNEQAANTSISKDVPGLQNFPTKKSQNTIIFNDDDDQTDSGPINFESIFGRVKEEQPVPAKKIQKPYNNEKHECRSLNQGSVDAGYQQCSNANNSSGGLGPSSSGCAQNFGTPQKRFINPPTNSHYNMKRNKFLSAMNGNFDGQNSKNPNNFNKIGDYNERGGFSNRKRGFFHRGGRGNLRGFGQRENFGNNRGKNRGDGFQQRNGRFHTNMTKIFGNRPKSPPKPLVDSFPMNEIDDSNQDFLNDDFGHSDDNVRQIPLEIIMPQKLENRPQFSEKKPPTYEMFETMKRININACDFSAKTSSEDILSKKIKQEVSYFDGENADDYDTYENQDLENANMEDEQMEGFEIPKKVVKKRGGSTKTQNSSRETNSTSNKRKVGGKARVEVKEDENVPSTSNSIRNRKCKRQLNQTYNESERTLSEEWSINSANNQFTPNDIFSTNDETDKGPVEPIDEPLKMPIQYQHLSGNFKIKKRKIEVDTGENSSPGKKSILKKCRIDSPNTGVAKNRVSFSDDLVQQKEIPHENNCSRKVADEKLTIIMHVKGTEPVYTYPENEPEHIENAKQILLPNSNWHQIIQLRDDYTKLATTQLRKCKKDVENLLRASLFQLKDLNLRDTKFRKNWFIVDSLFKNFDESSLKWTFMTRYEYPCLPDWLAEKLGEMFPQDFDFDSLNEVGNIYCGFGMDILVRLNFSRPEELYTMILNGYERLIEWIERFFGRGVANRNCNTNNFSGQSIPNLILITIPEIGTMDGMFEGFNDRLRSFAEKFSRTKSSTRPIVTLLDWAEMVNEKNDMTGQTISLEARFKILFNEAHFAYGLIRQGDRQCIPESQNQN